MTIASEITRIKTNIENAYTALEAKGATMPSEKNSANLASTVSTINFVGIPREITSDGVFQIPTQSFIFSLPNNVKSIGSGSLQNAFYNCKVLTAVDLSNITSIAPAGLESTFGGCTSLTSVDLSNLIIINNYGMQTAFVNCTRLTTILLENVTTIGAQGLRQAFQGCKLSSISFPSLNSKSFGSSRDQFYRMLYLTTGCTVHFPSNLKSLIGSWSDVTSGFGGTNTTVLFDLPATT